MFDLNGEMPYPHCVRVSAPKLGFRKDLDIMIQLHPRMPMMFQLAGKAQLFILGTRFAVLVGNRLHRP
jgi:hypothetical protein